MTKISDVTFESMTGGIAPVKIMVGRYDHEPGTKVTVVVTLRSHGKVLGTRGMRSFGVLQALFGTRVDADWWEAAAGSPDYRVAWTRAVAVAVRRSNNDLNLH